MKEHLVNVGVGGEGAAHGATARHHVEHAWWQPCLCADLREEQGAEAGVRGGLHHDCVAHGQRGCDLQETCVRNKSMLI